ADHHGPHIGLATDMVGVHNVVTRQMARNRRQARRTFEPAARAVDEIDSAGLELPGEYDRVVHVPVTALAIDHGHAKEQRLVLRPATAHRLRQLEAKSHAALQVAAIAIGPMIGDGREELIDEVTMGTVNLY